MEQLEVGQVLYKHFRYGKGVTRYTVERVTNTQGILNDGTKVKRPICTYSFGNSNQHVNTVGSYDTYQLETEELKALHEWTRLQHKIKTEVRELQVESLTTDQCKLLIAAFEATKLTI